MGSGSAERKARRAQANQIQQANELQASKDKETKELNQRIFDATKPMQEVASVEYGLQDRGDSSSYSDFDGGAVRGDYGSAGQSVDFGTNGSAGITKLTAEKENKPTMDNGNNAWFRQMFGL